MAKRRYGRTKRRRRRRRKRSSRVSKFKWSLPRTYAFRCKYSDQITWSGTPGAAQIYRFRTNSLFDPDFTGTGHQPTAVDEMARFYQRYAVVSAKIVVTFFPSEEAGSNYIGGVYCSNNDEPVTIPTPDDLQQARFSKNVAINSAGAATRTVVKTWSAKKWTGRSAVTDDVMHGRMPHPVTAGGTNAAVGSLFNVWIFPMGALTSSLGMDTKIDIYFNAILSEPHFLERS